MNKVIAITGASSGIGQATAILLTAKGAKLILNGRNADRLNQIVETIKSKEGTEVIASSGDVSKPEDVERIVQVACERYGRLDAIVSNAGIMPISPLDQLKVEDWNEMLNVNIKGVTNAIAAALPQFKKQQGGHFITVASTSGLKVVPGQAIYAGTKHAVRAIMDGLRQEMVPYHIRATIITSGATRTAIFDKRDQMEETKAKQMEAYYQMAMDPAAVARCIAFALEQPEEVNIGEIVVRSTQQP